MAGTGSAHLRDDVLLRIEDLVVEFKVGRDPGFRSCDRGVDMERVGEQARWGLCACACSAYAS